MDSETNLLKNNIDIVLSEFGRERDMWTELITKRYFWYEELKTKNADRQFTFLLSISAVSVGALAIITQVSNYNPLHILSYIYFLTCLITTSFSIILSTWWDDKMMPKNLKRDLDTFKEYRDSALAIYSDALKGVINKEKILSHLEKERVETDKNQEGKFFLNFMSTITLLGVVAFFFGIFLFVLGWIINTK